MLIDDADTIRPALDLRQAIVLRAMWAGLGWPGPCRQELQALGLVDAHNVTPAGERVVNATPSYLNAALIKMAFQLRKTCKGVTNDSE